MFRIWIIREFLWCGIEPPDFLSHGISYILRISNEIRAWTALSTPLGKSWWNITTRTESLSVQRYKESRGFPVAGVSEQGYPRKVICCATLHKSKCYLSLTWLHRNLVLISFSFSFFHFPFINLMSFSCHSLLVNISGWEIHIHTFNKF